MGHKLNLATSIFPGLNDKRGILVCGYEWGMSKKDQHAFADNKFFINEAARTTFSNKTSMYGKLALKRPYDRRIIKWFDLWGHKLSTENLGGDFEKCIAQTNWCNTQGHHISESYYTKLSDEAQVNNFIYHVKELDPSLILFMGSAMVDILQSEQVKPKFIEVVGSETSPLRKIQKDFLGIRFKIGLQEFERCNIVSLPHPSSSRGLSDEYIALFKSEIGRLISQVKTSRDLV